MYLCRIGTLAIFGLLALVLSASGQQTEISKSTVSTTAELSDTTTGPYGGRVFRRDQYVLDVLIDPDGVRVYVSDSTGRLLDPRGAEGRCIFPKDSGGFYKLQFEVMKAPGKRLPRYRSTAKEKGRCLFTPFDFSLFHDTMMRMRLEFSKLPEQRSANLGFSIPVVLTRLRGWACRGHEGRIMTEYKETPLCETRYLVEVPFLYQCPNHADSRSDQPSLCPLCSSARVPTMQAKAIAPQPKGMLFPGKR